MRARRKSRGSSSRVRFLGASRSPAHRRWFRTIAEHYDFLGPDPHRAQTAAAFLDRLFRTHGNVQGVLDVACGTFSIDIPLYLKGYRVVGRDLSSHMLAVARDNARRAGVTANLARGDMRSLRLRRTFDAVLCLGTAFNYLTTSGDIRKALDTFYHHLRPGGLVVLDLTNFDAWIDHPRNIGAEVDFQAHDGTRIAIFAFNEQNPSKTIHIARFFTVVQRGKRIEIGMDESPLKVWTETNLSRTLSRHGFRPIEWYGDLKIGSRYRCKESSRMIAVAVRR